MSPYLWKRFCFSLLCICVISGIPFNERSLSMSPRSMSAVTPIPLFENTLENIPKHSEGQRQYQFYNMGPDGALYKQWMSLQEVQNIILAYALTRQSDVGALKFKSSFLPVLPSNNLQGKFNIGRPLNAAKKPRPKKPQRASVEDVLANVQKVMSKEITDKFINKTDQLSTPSITVLSEETSTDSMKDIPQNITIPDTILAHLMKEQVESLETHSPWGIISPKPITEIFSNVSFIESDMASTPQILLDDEMDQENFIVDEAATTTVPSTVTENIATTNTEFNSTVTSLNTDEDSSSSTTEDNTNVTTSNLKLNAATTFVNLEKFISNVLETDPSAFDKPSYTFIPVGDLEDNDLLLRFGLTIPTEESFTTLTEEPKTITTTKEIFLSTEQDTSTTLTEEPRTISTDISQTLSDETLVSVSQTPTTILPETSTITEKYYSTSEEEFTENLPSKEITTNETPLNDKQNKSTINLQEATSTATSLPTTNRISTKKQESITSTSTKLPEKESTSEKPKTTKKPTTKSSIHSGKKEDVVVSTNVLSPLEMAPLSPENLGHLGTLQAGEAQNEYLDDYSPVYLEDIAETDYDIDDIASPSKSKSNTTSSGKLDFPSPQATDSYGRPDNIQVHSTDYIVDPTQFLPSHNPELAKGENPLRKTPEGNIGLEKTIVGLKPEVRGYVDAMNDVAFQIYKEAAKIHRRQNLVMSPINLISSLSMLTLGARGSTAESISHLLRTDEFLMFNPHLLLKNISETVLDLNNIGHEVALVNSVLIEKPEIKPYDVTFFSRSVDYFYDSIVRQVDANDFGSVARDLANEGVRKQTLGAVQNFLKPKASLKINGPLSIVSSAYFQGNWNIDIREEDIFDMSFIRFPSAERRLIRTVGINRRMRLNAGYCEELDATVTEIPLKSASKEISLILVMPGRQKRFVANGLSMIEQSLSSNNWSKFLKAVIPHTLTFKMPIFSHRNYLNVSSIFATLELDSMFQGDVDFSGINGAKELHLGDVVQLTEFHSCKLNMKMFAARSLESDVPESQKMDEAEQIIKSSRAILPQNGGHVSNDHESPDNVNVLSYDRAFFYVLRHNPTGLILFIGRYLDPETF